MKIFYDIIFTVLEAEDANIAQLVEQQFRKLQAKGSSPFVGSILSGCSAAWQARLVRDEKVAGSNPVTPTIFF
jgi:hypothetical protein